MEKVPSFNALIESAIISNWDRDALTDYKGVTLQYHDVARKIEKLHIMFDYSGIKSGDKIAICGRNSSLWACAFLATVTYGAVVVPIQHEFTPEQIYNIVNHSESKLLFVGDVVSTALDTEMMPNLDGIFYLPDFSLVASRSERLTVAREHLNELYGQKYPKYFRQEHVHYYHDEGEELAMINYTSGTTGFSKGVMLPFRSLWSNLDFLTQDIGSKLKKHCDVLSILPMAHMYGLSCEFLLQFCCGNHLYFLTRVPSPTIIQEAFMDIRPNIIVSVPLIIEKIIRTNVFPLINNYRVRMLMKMPGVKKIVRERICQKVMEFMGGNIYEVVIGGASFSKEIEEFFTSINFPITVGYGTTETGPMITYSDYRDFVPGSCGTAVKHMEVRILSKDPENEAGEIVTRGLNVMQGYYKNAKATNEVIDKDGWFHTGDLAKMSKDGHVFILGRIKNMLLGANGQNVYPEEIEDRLNSMTMVSESIIVQKGDKLVGLIHPDLLQAQSLGFTEEDLRSVMEQNRKELNAKLPPFCKISEFRLQDKEFEKTPKKSIKRYLYQNSI
ncbi:MAG: AMP-binding protein [Prevotella sp.]|nr:AMP-binding protein [Prevotella sp.]